MESDKKHVLLIELVNAKAKVRQIASDDGKIHIGILVEDIENLGFVEMVNELEEQLH